MLTCEVPRAEAQAIALHSKRLLRVERQVISWPASKDFLAKQWREFGSRAFLRLRQRDKGFSNVGVNGIGWKFIENTELLRCEKFLHRHLHGFLLTFEMAVEPAQHCELQFRHFVVRPGGDEQSEFISGFR